MHEIVGVHVGSIPEANRALTAPSVGNEHLILNYHIPCGIKYNVPGFAKEKFVNNYMHVFVLCTVYVRVCVCRRFPQYSPVFFFV